MKKKNHYLSYNEYININDYKKFLKNIYNNLSTETNIFNFPIIKNKNMCNCNVNSLTNIKFLTSASNDIYIANIKKKCITNSTYFNNNIKKLILKVCKGYEDDDEDEYSENECLYIDELITSILFSRLVIKNITSNLLLLFGYMNNCKLNYNNS